ncbi:ABC transporter ATP-binding protein [Microbacterium sp. M1A1_1b]
MTQRRAHITAEGLGYDIGTRTLWDGLDVRVGPGEALALRGPSGQGKSTLLRCLGGLERATRGTIHVAGMDLDQAHPRALRRLRRHDIGFVMQDHAIVPEWTIEQNLRVLPFTAAERREVPARMHQSLLMVGLHGRQRVRAGTLSGGEQQRVAVARVLLQRPRIVLADEPTASLDDESSARVRSGLDVLRASGSAVVVATHDPELVMWADRSLDLSAR